MSFARTAGKALGALCALGIFGTFVHSIVAMASSPPLWPSRWIIDLQVLWTRGSYELKYSWGVTWFYELAPFGAAIVLHEGGSRLLDALRSPRAKEATVGWESLLRRSRARCAALGAMLLAGAGLFLWLVSTAPALLSPAGIAAEVPLLVAPFAIVGGLVLLLDGVVPPEVHVGSVESREIVANKPGSTLAYRVKLAGKTLDVSVEVYNQMGDGAQFRVESAAVSGRMLALARKQLGYRQ